MWNVITIQFPAGKDLIYLLPREVCINWIMAKVLPEVLRGSLVIFSNPSGEIFFSGCGAAFQ